MIYRKIFLNCFQRSYSSHSDNIRNNWCVGSITYLRKAFFKINEISNPMGSSIKSINFIKIRHAEMEIFKWFRMVLFVVRSSKTGRRGKRKNIDRSEEVSMIKMTRILKRNTKSHVGRGRRPKSRRNGTKIPSKVRHSESFKRTILSTEKENAVRFSKATTYFDRDFIFL